MSRSLDSVFFTEKEKTSGSSGTTNHPNGKCEHNITIDRYCAYTHTLITSTDNDFANKKTPPNKNLATNNTICLFFPIHPVIVLTIIKKG